MATTNRSNNKVHIGNGSKNPSVFTGEVNDLSQPGVPEGIKAYYKTQDRLKKPSGGGPWYNTPNDFSEYNGITYGVMEDKVIRYNASGSIESQHILGTSDIETIGFFKHSTGGEYFFISNKLDAPGSTILYGQINQLTFNDDFLQLQELKLKPLERLGGLAEYLEEDFNLEENTSDVIGPVGVYGHYANWYSSEETIEDDFYNPFGSHDHNEGYGQQEGYLEDGTGSQELGLSNNQAVFHVRNVNMDEDYYKQVFNKSFMDSTLSPEYWFNLYFNHQSNINPAIGINVNQIIQIPGEDSLLFQFRNEDGSSYGWNESTVFKAEMTLSGAFFYDLEFGSNINAYFAPIEYLGTPYGNSDPDGLGTNNFDEHFEGGSADIRSYSPIQCYAKQNHINEGNNPFRITTFHRFNLTAPGGRDIGSLSILGKIFDPYYTLDNLVTGGITGFPYENSLFFEEAYKPQSYKLKFFNESDGSLNYDSSNGAFFGLSIFNNLAGRKATASLDFDFGLRKHIELKNVHPKGVNTDDYYGNGLADAHYTNTSDNSKGDWKKSIVQDFLPTNFVEQSNAKEMLYLVTDGDDIAAYDTTKYFARNKRYRSSQNMINFIDYLDCLFVDDISEGVIYPKKAISIVSQGNTIGSGGHKIMVAFSPAENSNIFKYSQIALNAGQNRGYTVGEEPPSNKTQGNAFATNELQVSGIRITPEDIISVEARDGLAFVPNGGMCTGQKRVDEGDCFLYKGIVNVTSFSMSNNPYVGKSINDDTNVCSLNVSSKLDLPIDSDSPLAPAFNYNENTSDAHQSSSSYLFLDQYLENLDTYVDDGDYSDASAPYFQAIMDNMPPEPQDFSADDNYPMLTTNTSPEALTDAIIQGGTSYDGLTTLSELWAISDSVLEVAPENLTGLYSIVFNRTSLFIAASPENYLADIGFKSEAYPSDVDAPNIPENQNNFDEYFKVNKRFLSFDERTSQVYQGSLNSTDTIYDEASETLQLVDLDYYTSEALQDEVITLNAGTGTTAPDATGINFAAPFKVVYKLSYLYDNFQESPLSLWEEAVNEASNDKSSYTIDIRFNIDTFNKRVTHINLYRQYIKSDGTGDNYYQLVSSMPLAPLTRFSLLEDNRYQYVIVDDRSPNASYASLVGIPETVPNTYLNYGIATVGDSYLFVTNADVPYSTGDFSHYIFRSMPNGRFSQFNWPTDNVRVPDKITAMQAHNGRLYAFSEAKMFLINQSTLEVEDIFEGTGCENSNAIISTEYGLCFADLNNIYLLTSSGPQIISDTIATMSANSAPDGMKGWQDLNKSNIHVSFDSVRKSFLVFFTYSNRRVINSRCWAYNIVRKRWDLWSTAGPVTNVYISKKGFILYTANNRFYKFLSSSAPKSWSWHSKEFVLTGATQDKKFRNVKISSDKSIQDSSLSVVLNKSAIAASLKKEDSLEGSVYQKVAKLLSGSGSNKFKTLRIELNNVRNAEVDSIGLVYTSKKAK